VVRLTVHHANHDRNVNEQYNLELVHKQCHQTYHREVNSGKRGKTGGTRYLPMPAHS
jgi:hypothetical protein